ncbi:unnamed protein product [Penicillium salamii]|uniref:Uncharacterized protein n=2 Tax=Penicillium TaxID=5073 RepID=A0A9W4I5J1_9EURO|nr:unnamed protein product [Penicillium salamii]CRL30298.1 unnamed protein product [Penicillium camemberti]CAG7975562.1 unnamed protein product [Penicillium salamii]CAG8238877.1 unnamed protein product [Penicillium salamii]CAG8242395.1 unnamed protein product [Penicillium salamii]
MKLPLKSLDLSLKEVDPRDRPIGSRNVQADTGNLWTHTLMNTNSFDSPFPGAFPYYSVSQSPVCGKPFCAAREYLETAKRPEACFQCFASEGLPDKVRFQMFHDPGYVTRHFDAIHLKEELLKCNWCEVGLLHRMAF